MGWPYKMVLGTLNGVIPPDLAFPDSTILFPFYFENLSNIELFFDFPALDPAVLMYHIQ